MIILGLNHGEIISSAAIYKDGCVVAAACEERFTRDKKTKAFPQNAIQALLNYRNLTFEDVDFVAQGWNPGAYWIKFNPLLSATRTQREHYLYTIPDNLFNLTERAPSKWVEMNFDGGSGMAPIFYLQHHLCHAANAFYLSSFEEAAILTCDFQGEFESTSMCTGRGNKIKRMGEANIPNSLGLLYGTITEFLGYRPDHDEWKVMALSAFDLDASDFEDKMLKTLSFGDGNLELDQTYFKGAIVNQPHLYTQKLVDLFGGRVGKRQEKPDEWHIKIAKALQSVSEKIAFSMLERLYAETACKNVCLGGGFFMNCVINGQVTEKTPFDNVYISHSPGDSGNSLGAALYLAHQIKGEKRTYGMNHSYLGVLYDDTEIERALSRRRLSYEKCDDIADRVAKLLAQGKVVAFFNGRSEFGERALGNRSILADPRRADMKDKINSMIKYREPYRPFAPAALRDKASKFFDVGPDYECLYMEKVVPVKDEYRDQLPAITHVDGSGRLQTVARDTNHVFASVIENFEALTGYPIVLNTSFNIANEPIVETPDDAISTFYNSGLEYLTIGNFLLSK